MKTQIPHCSRDGDYSVERPRLRVADGGRLVQLHFARSPAMEWNAELFGKHASEVARRGLCRGFSFSSRRRMLGRVNEVSAAAPMPCFVTLTFPDSVFDDDAGRFAKTAKLCLDTFFKRLHRVAPQAAALWRLEWQARKSGEHEGKLVPHFHLLVWGLEWRDSAFCQGESKEAFVPVIDQQLHMDLVDVYADFKNKCLSKNEWVYKWRGAPVNARFAWSQTLQVRAEHAEMMADQEPSERMAQAQQYMSFQDWASLAWYHVVNSGDVNHFTAGVRCERVRSWGGVMHYCAKYMAKADSEFLSEVPYGRNWGIANRACLPWAKIVELELDSDVGVRLRRVARKMLERRVGRRWKAPYGITIYCNGTQFLRLLKTAPDAPF